jgi:integrase/recombinase XerD
MAAVPGPRLKYRAALGISYGAGLRASKVCNLKVKEICQVIFRRLEDEQMRQHQATISPT